MKKILSVIMVGILAFALAGCGGNKTESSSAVESETQPAAGKGGKALVVYFSWSGNTENVANAIAAQTGADIFEIVPEEPYSDDYNALLDIAAKEKESGARPAIAGSVEDMAQYDIIYVGYPNMEQGFESVLCA